jgi:hypothetical protein
MPAEALISTSRLHRQVDRYFQEHGLYYDRRKGHYKDQGIEISKIISVLTVVQAVVAIILRKPDDARGRPGDYIKNEKKRWSVFGPDEYRPPAQPELIEQDAPYDLGVYLQCVLVLRRVDEFLEDPKLRLDNAEIRNLRFYLMRYASCALTKNAHCPPGELAKTKIDNLTDDNLKKYLGNLQRIYRHYGANDDAAKGKHMVRDLDTELLASYSAPNIATGQSKRLRRRVKA